MLVEAKGAYGTRRQCRWHDWVVLCEPRESEYDGLVSSNCDE